MKDITAYGNFLYTQTNKSSALRHKLFKHFNFRCVISPQYYSKTLNVSLALHGYALDNGAFIDFKKNTMFGHDKFIECAEAIGAGADFIVIPDVVQNARATISQSWIYINKLVQLGFRHKLLFVFQDGMTDNDLHPYVCQGIGVFIGGSTKAKLSSIPWISKLCNKYNVWCHVGRVNTKSRIQKCIDYNVSSFDGSGFNMFPSSFTAIEDIKNNKQMSLFTKEKNTSLIQSFESRCKCLNVSQQDVVSFWNDINKINTDGVGIPKRNNKKIKSLFNSLNLFQSFLTSD